MWHDGKGHFLRELVSSYIGYTWFSFASAKALPHPAASTSTTNRNRGFLSGVSYTRTQPTKHAQMGCKGPQRCSVHFLHQRAEVRWSYLVWSWANGNVWHEICFVCVACLISEKKSHSFSDPLVILWVQPSGHIFNLQISQSIRRQYSDWVLLCLCYGGKLVRDRLKKRWLQLMHPRILHWSVGPKRKTPTAIIQTAIKLCMDIHCFQTM